MKTHAFRLLPGSDLKAGIQKVVNEKGIAAGWVLTCVGSLRQFNIRCANQEQGRLETGYFEIVSLTGTLSCNGSHIHISASDSSGQTIGGHLLDDSLVYTTAEVVIGYDDGLVFTRENDGSTKWRELQIKQAPPEG